MVFISRSLEKWALNNPVFPQHMSFILGPRQCGKTTLAQHYLKNKEGDLKGYFNWDSERVRRAHLKEPYFFENLIQPRKKVTLVFDEIHKRRLWKKYLKGAYDQFKDQFQIIVTGSGRLDLFQRGGDSLAGRYDPYFLYPLSPGELEKRQPAKSLGLTALKNASPIPDSTMSSWEHLGGFPEPFLSGSQNKAAMWWKQYKIRVTEEDVRDLTKLESMDLMKNLLEIMPDKIGSPLSLNSLREDLDCSHPTIQRYVKTLNQVFFTFELLPFHKKIHRSIKKERKLYFFNHFAIKEKGAKFENMVALLLNKWCSQKGERALGEWQLFYLRDQNRREVDFLIAENGKPSLLLEAKYNDHQFSSSLKYYQSLLKIPAILIVNNPNMCVTRDNGLVCSIHRLASLCG